MNIAIVTGCLAPYASRLYGTYAKSHGADVTIYQCAKIEPGRKWNTPLPSGFRLVSLDGYRHHKSDISHVYFNPGIVPQLAKQRPDFVIIDSFSPTMLMAASYSIATGTPFALAIEGARDLDPGENSKPHAIARRLLAKRAKIGICTSECAREMMAFWGLPVSDTVLVPHAGSWNAPDNNPDFADRPFDLLICGTLNDRKNPLFFADVAANLARNGFKPRVRIVGDGQLRDAVNDRLKAAGITAQFDGYLQQDGIIDAYQSAKLLLFPTKADTWGLVANEALLCGTPILASPHAVSARELVLDYSTGLVKPLDIASWTAAVQHMLSSSDVWQTYRSRRAEAMRHYSLDASVAAFANAVAMGTTTRAEYQRDLSRDAKSDPVEIN